jgi:PqqD family protein of HPr-rel-A system
MSAAEPLAWKIGDPSGLCWKIWDGECVVFDGRSGETHLLNPLAVEVLQTLEQGPADGSHLTRLIASTLALEAEPDLARAVDEVLARFDELGLTEPVEG